jgi:hypothetical protein
MKTFYSVQILKGDGRFETVVNTANKSLSIAEASRQQSLGWSGQIITEKTRKQIRAW